LGEESAAWLCRGRLVPDQRHSGDAKLLAEESAGNLKRFDLESLEPRILLSGDPVMAELARMAATADSLDAPDQPSVIVEEIDAAL